MTTLEDVTDRSGEALTYAIESGRARDLRDASIVECYRAGNATLQQLANATGLSKARVAQIVNDWRG